MDKEIKRYGVFVLDANENDDEPNTIHCNAFIKPFAVFPDVKLAREKQKSLINILTKSKDKRKVVIRTILDALDVAIYKQEQIAARSKEAEKEKDNRHETLIKLMASNNIKKQGK
ncbi:hypothetical protein [Kluyvera sichuanensis]|uniref:hypothetical protein n=1 Tax=Kluyvera sichuanensis TaxID=2725494 RepID=UPI002FD3164C